MFGYLFVYSYICAALRLAWAVHILDKHWATPCPQVMLPLSIRSCVCYSIVLYPLGHKFVWMLLSFFNWCFWVLIVSVTPDRDKAQAFSTWTFYMSHSKTSSSCWCVEQYHSNGWKQLLEWVKDCVLLQQFRSLNFVRNLYFKVMITCLQIYFFVFV